MTVIPDKDLQSALNNALAEAFPMTPIAWENAGYIDPMNPDITAPVVGTPYFRVFLLPAETDVITLGPSPYQERKGIFQVSVLHPLGVGFGPPKDTVVEVVTAFKVGTVFTYNTLRVICDKVWPSSGRKEDNAWYHVPVNIRYHCESNA